MNLTPEQEAKITNVVDSHRFTIATLRDDIIDHLCCVVEHKMSEKNTGFDEALRQALYELSPDGLSSIEEETFFLINTSKLLSMKKLTFLFGLLSAMSICMGWTFKILHLDFGNELSVFGLMGFILLFLPMIAINHFKFAIKHALSERLRIILGYGSALLIGFAIVFKILHLQGADLLLLLGAAVFSFGFLPFLFFNMYRKSLTKP